MAGNRTSSTIEEATPMTTRAQAQSNKANAQKSTGPTSVEGKKRSSLNSLIHGLRSEEVVLPGEDAAAFEAERAAWFDDFKPKSQARAALVERAVVAAWRCRRCVRIETQRLGNIGRLAIKNQDAEARERVKKAVNLFEAQPRQALLRLEGEYEGLLALIEIWTQLVDAASSADHWGSAPSHHTWLLSLLGLTGDSEAEDAGPVGVASWRLIVRVDPEVGDDKEGPLDDRETARLLRNLQTFIKDKIAGLKMSLGRFTDPAEFRDRIATAASIDTSEAGKLLLRYEATHDRSLRATISSLIQLEKSGADLHEAEAEPTPEAIAPSEPIGPKPIEDKALPEESATRTGTGPQRPTPVITTETDPEPFTKAERDRGGRSWEGEDEILSHPQR